MAKIEEATRWGIDEIIKRTLELQGATIDQKKVLFDRIMPHHAHFFGWGNLDPEKVARLRAKYEPLIEHPRFREVNDIFDEVDDKLRDLFTDYLTGSENDEVLGGNLSVGSGWEIPLVPRGVVQPKGHIWPVEKALEFFDWDDYQVSVELSSHRLIERWPAWENLPVVRGPFINTTRKETGSSLFSVDIALGERNPRNQVKLFNYFSDRIDSLRNQVLIRSLDVGSFSVSQQSQRLLITLLDARV